MTEQVWVAIATIGVVQLIAAIGGWIQVQVRLSAIELRQKVGEKQHDELVQVVKEIQATRSAYDQELLTELRKLTAFTSRMDNQ